MVRGSQSFDSSVFFQLYAAFNTSGGYADGPAFLSGRYSSTGVYNNENTFLITGYYGGYITIELPNPIKLSKYGFSYRTLFPTWSPGLYKIYGSNDGSNWTVWVDTNTTKIVIKIFF